MSSFHIIPAAGSATRIGGLPKYLLPIGKHAQPLLFFHIKMAQNCNIPVLIGVHPSLFEFVSELCASWNISGIEIIPIHSKTMTETCIRVAASLPESARVSISMPDTYFTEMDNIDTFTPLVKLQETSPSLALWKIQASQIGKLGQVEIENLTGKVAKIIDKDLNCLFEDSWGMISLPLSLMRAFPISDSHPGISLARRIPEGLDVNHLAISGRYFDCGTISEYREALNLSFS